MKTITLANLAERARNRPPGYQADVLAHAVNVTAATYSLSDEDFAMLRQKWTPRPPKTATPPRPAAPPPPPPAPVPYDQWPAHIKLIASLRAEGERDVGQTATRLAGKAGKTFELWFRALTGKSCGCAERRAEWAALYPYEIRTPALLAV